MSDYESLLKLAGELDKPQPKLSVGFPNDRILNKIGFHKAAKDPMYLGMLVRVDPNLPANVFRVEYPDGRQQLFCLTENGGIFEYTVPTLFEQLQDSFRLRP